MKVSKATIIILIVALVAVGGVAVYAISGGFAPKDDKTTTATHKASDDQTKKDDQTASNGPAKCMTSELSAEAAVDAGGGAAGSVYATLTLKNKSNETCTLYGYPGVSLMNNSGETIGKAADRAEADQVTLTLKPGDSARSQLRFVQNNFDPGTCKDGATELMVYPPDQKDALMTATPHTEWCPGFTVGPLTR